MSDKRAKKWAQRVLDNIGNKNPIGTITDEGGNTITVPLKPDKGAINEAKGILGYPGYEGERDMAHGGYVKKYAHGGGVRKAKFMDS